MFLSGEFHDQRSLVSYSPWGHKGSDRAEQAGQCLEEQVRPLTASTLWGLGPRTSSLNTPRSLWENSRPHLGPSDSESMPYQVIHVYLKEREALTWVTLPFTWQVERPRTGGHSLAQVKGVQSDSPCVNGLPPGPGPYPWAMVLHLVFYFPNWGSCFPVTQKWAGKGRGQRRWGRRGDGKKVCLPSFLCSAQESHWKGEEGNLEPWVARRGASPEAWPLVLSTESRISETQASGSLPALYTASSGLTQITSRWAGTWDTLLQSTHLDKRLLKRQNTEKLEGTKNITACMRSRGKFMDKIQKDQKSNCYFWRARSKNKVWEAKLECRAGYCACPLHSAPPKGWANHLSHQPDPWTHPLPSPHIKNQLAHPAQGAGKGTCYFFSIPPVSAGATIKLCLNFLSGLWSISID